MKFSNEVRSVEERSVGCIRRMLVACALIGLTACGGGGGGGGGSVSVTTPSSPSGTNSVALSVNGGPGNNVNLPLITIQVCEAAGSNCVTVNNVIVDTGSSGLRVLRSALGSLSLQNSVSGNPLYECVKFADNSQAWGPVQIADVKIAGKTASSAHIQVIGDTSGVTEPSACGTTGENLDSVAALGANAILGVGYFVEDCGSACNSVNNGLYFSCTSTSCTASSAALLNQVENPVAKFSGDNNGVVIQLPAVAAAGVASVAGTLTFGIDTQSNNALGSATVFTPNAVGYVSTTYHGTTYPSSFIDSGSNGFYFPNTDPTNLPTCTTTLTDFYCPSSTRTVSATLIGANSASSVISFAVVNTQSFSSTVHAASTLAGVYANGFDWGMPFFFGRTVFTAFENKSDGPYTAF